MGQRDDGVVEPERFGRYELRGELASGGMGTVHAARAIGPGGFKSYFAIKRIHEHLSKDPRFVAMFLDEARIAARLEHPNVCGVVDFGQVDGRYYLAMPFVLGETLKAVRRAALSQGGPVRESSRFIVCRILADACEGLHAAHELRAADGELLDVVHRDVSPHNLLVGYDGVARVIDFGVASARERLHRTATGEVKGKFSYGAPEQFLDGELTRQADVWALGVVLWECLAGRSLFLRATMAQTVRAVCTAPVPPLSARWPDVPPALEKIVETALSREPSQRYATARAMGRALHQMLHEVGAPVTAADVADWMRVVFPDGERTKRALVERATDPPRSEVRPTEPDTPGDSTVGESQVRGVGASARRDAASGAPGDEPAGARRPALRPRRPIEVDPPPEPSRARRSIQLGGFAVGFLVLVALAFAQWSQRRGGDAAEPGAIMSAEPTTMQHRRAPAPVEIVPMSPTLPSTPIEEPAEAEAVVSEVEGSAPTEPDEEVAEVGAVEPRAELENAEAQTMARAERSRVTRASRGNRRRQTEARGTLHITLTEGWANVYDGPQLIGRAPGAFQLSSGRHLIRVQPSGIGPGISRTVDLASGESIRVRIETR